MKKRMTVFTVLRVAGATLLGNYLGGRLHEAITKRPTHGVVYYEMDDMGMVNRINVPMIPNFYPAFLLGLMARPHARVGFFGGLLASALMGDQVERQLLQRLADLRQPDTAGTLITPLDEEVPMTGIRLGG
jgi:hypothetical protein